ncbi:MAG: GAP family protein [Solirubrobacteraceae bacterium]
MPADALALAFAASIYPPAVAAVIALGRGPQLRWRVFAFVAAAYLTTLATGVVILLLLNELGATDRTSLSASAGVDLALGVLLLALAWHLHRRRPRPGEVPSGHAGPSKIDRYLKSRRLAALLGVTLYLVPSPIYIGAVKALADANRSGVGELADLVAIVAVMLWLIELPMLILLIAPQRAERALQDTNRWFRDHGRSIAIIASAAVGAYLLIKGAVDIGE